MKQISWLIAVLALVVLAVRSPASAADTGFGGVWDVTTRLVTSTGPVNPDYKPGDIRVDVWRITGSAGQSFLTTKDGTIPGQVSGNQARFGADVPLGQIIIMRIMIDAFLTSSGSMKGTISSEYWDRRFGYKVGLDAWTFEALRR